LKPYKCPLKNQSKEEEKKGRMGRKILIRKINVKVQELSIRIS
jgi:hypothetical protein